MGRQIDQADKTTCTITVPDASAMYDIVVRSQAGSPSAPHASDPFTVCFGKLFCLVIVARHSVSTSLRLHSAGLWHGFLHWAVAGWRPDGAARLHDRFTVSARATVTLIQNHHSDSQNSSFESAVLHECAFFGTDLWLTDRRSWAARLACAPALSEAADARWQPRQRGALVAAVRR